MISAHLSPGILQAGLEPYPGHRLTRFLGRGGFSEVWEADSKGGEPVALKFMSSADGRATPREIRSIQTVRQLEHPNLIRIDRVWLFQRYIVIAMELAEGGLNDLLQAHQDEFDTPIPIDQVCFFLSQAAAVLDFLNTRQHRVNGQVIAIQHCDVKPSNLLLCGDRVKLSDFGLASQTTGSLNFHQRAGTTAYAAPEVYKGRLTDRTDQYSLAVTYCELRTGRLPFPDAPASFTRQYAVPRPELDLLTPAERPIVSRALSPVPQNRWPSCSAFVQRLAELLR